MKECILDPHAQQPFISNQMLKMSAFCGVTRDEAISNTFGRPATLAADGNVFAIEQTTWVPCDVVLILLLLFRSLSLALSIDVSLSFICYFARCFTLSLVVSLVVSFFIPLVGSLFLSLSCFLSHSLLRCLALFLAVSIFLAVSLFLAASLLLAASLFLAVSFVLSYIFFIQLLSTPVTPSAALSFCLFFSTISDTSHFSSCLFFFFLFFQSHSHLHSRYYCHNYPYD